ncbi:hypothetical protein ACFXG6_15285 [Streptomyces roseus]|uniref:hypothetical protein n=1 Tax=Streptomyces roseus TaxID=66430 RepID=UPI0036898EBD
MFHPSGEVELREEALAHLGGVRDLRERHTLDDGGSPGPGGGEVTMVTSPSVQRE